MRLPFFVLAGVAATLFLFVSGCKQNDGHPDHNHSMRQTTANAAV